MSPLPHHWRHSCSSSAPLPELPTLRILQHARATNLRPELHEADRHLRSILGSRYYACRKAPTCCQMCQCLHLSPTWVLHSSAFIGVVYRQISTALKKNLFSVNYRSSTSLWFLVTEALYMNWVSNRTPYR